MLRGYSENEVDDFLDKVVADYEALLKQNAQLREDVDELRSRVEQYRQLENTLHSTLIVAQETAEEVKQSARKEAQIIVREAEEEGKRIAKAAEARVHEAEERLAQMQREAQAFRAQLRSLLEGHLELLRGDTPFTLPSGRRSPRAVGDGSNGDTQVVSTTA